MRLNAPIPEDIALNSGRMEKGMKRRVRQQVFIVLPVFKQYSNGKRQDMSGQCDVCVATMAMTQRRAVIIITMVVMMVSCLYIFLTL